MLLAARRGVGRPPAAARAPALFSCSRLVRPAVRPRGHAAAAGDADGAAAAEAVAAAEAPPPAPPVRPASYFRDASGVLHDLSMPAAAPAAGAAAGVRAAPAGYAPPPSPTRPPATDGAGDGALRCSCWPVPKTRCRSCPER
jgi:hypothetical protein